MRRVQVIDSHSGGEPTRVVVGGAPDLGPGPLAARREAFRDRFDTFRSAVVNEPRGSDVLVGALLVEPHEPGCVAGVIFFNNVGMLGMCGHGTMGVAVTLAHLGRIGPGRHRLDTPVGVVGFEYRGGARVTVENVPSDRLAASVTLDVEGLGTVSGDVAWGGNWFFLTSVPGARLDVSQAGRLTDRATRIRDALTRAGITGRDGAEIDHVELFGPPADPGNHARNFVLCPGGAYDRSPCGTGTSAKLACLAADGALAPGEVWRQESLVGSVFEGSYPRDAEGRVVPVITGEAYLTAESSLLLDPADPFVAGGPVVSGTGHVVVVGGGVVGASCAYYLAKAGRSVTVVDAGAVGSGCSYANCGYVCPSHVLPLAAPGAIRALLRVMARKDSPVRIRPGVLLRNPGWFLGFARRCNEPHMLAAGGAIRGLLGSSRSLYDELIREERIECEWESKGLLFVFRTLAAMDHYAEVDHLLGERFGLPARRLDGDGLATLEPALRPGLAGAWWYEGDAHLRPDRLMVELRRVLVGRGVAVLEDRRVTGLLREGGRATGVRTEHGDIPADDVVVALGAWTPLLERDLGCRVPIQPGKGYSLTFPGMADGPSYPMIFEEDRVAVTPFRSGLRVGSMMEFAGYDATLDPKRLRLLTETSNRYLRTPLTGQPEHQWWGWRPMTPDGLPLIGPSPRLPNVWVAAGHNMLGVSMAPATGKLVAEMIGGARPHLDPSPYEASRF